MTDILQATFMLAIIYILVHLLTLIHSDTGVDIGSVITTHLIPVVVLTLLYAGLKKR